MDNNNQNNRYANGNENYIDKSTFERRRRAAEIIENEEIERQKRRREQLRRRNAERMLQEISEVRSFASYSFPVFLRQK